MTETNITSLYPLLLANTFVIVSAALVAIAVNFQLGTCVPTIQDKFVFIVDVLVLV